MTKETTRRDFVKTATVAATGAAVGTTVAATDAAAQSVRINSAAKGVLSDGKLVSRGEVLQQLGLNPNTPPDAWLAIIACGSNASALKAGELKGLVDRGVIKREMLDKKTLQTIR